MQLTLEQLVGAVHCSPGRGSIFLPYINETLKQYEINTPLRAAHFLAQVAHESAGLVYVREIWNPAKCKWQATYEGRESLGNIRAGDGFKYRGRGLIQITGRANTTECGEALGENLVDHPELLETPELASLSAGWFWSKHKLNALADKNMLVRITEIINGGHNGLQDRYDRFAYAKSALGVK